VVLRFVSTGVHCNRRVSSFGLTKQGEIIWELNANRSAGTAGETQTPLLEPLHACYDPENNQQAYSPTNHKHMPPRLPHMMDMVPVIMHILIAFPYNNQIHELKLIFSKPEILNPGLLYKASKRFSRRMFEPSADFI
jgi:hypothetical protein